MNAILKKHFKIGQEVYNLVFVHPDDKFVVNAVNGRTNINPKYVRKIQEYNIFKEFIVGSADPENGLVDISLLQGYLDQLDIRFNIMSSMVKDSVLHLPNFSL